MVFSELQKKFLQLKYCPVCQKELRCPEMGSKKLYCLNHGTFVLSATGIRWEE